jgi:hypothetical protein
LAAKDWGLFQAEKPESLLGLSNYPKEFRRTLIKGALIDYEKRRKSG